MIWSTLERWESEVTRSAAFELQFGGTATAAGTASAAQPACSARPWRAASRARSPPR